VAAAALLVAGLKLPQSMCTSTATLRDTPPTAAVISTVLVPVSRGMLELSLLHPVRAVAAMHSARIAGTARRRRLPSSRRQPMMSIGNSKRPSAACVATVGPMTTEACTLPSAASVGAGVANVQLIPTGRPEQDSSTSPDMPATEPIVTGKGADGLSYDTSRLALAAVTLGVGVVLLDEPTAQLDVRGEAEIFDRLLAATRHCTTILISHRFSTVRHADRICVLEQGRVIELGTHDELMALGGRYRTMFDLQAQRFNVPEEEGTTYDVLS